MNAPDWLMPLGIFGLFAAVLIALVLWVDTAAGDDEP